MKGNPVKKLLHRNFELLIYLIYFFCGLGILWMGRSNGLFPMPGAGTDQLSMFQCAAGLTSGKFPDFPYRYSYAYTLFLTLLHGMTGGSLLGMRILQLAVCSLIPVFLYRTARLLGLGKAAGQYGAICYLFYGPALLISLDFLRAAPLGLVFLLYFYFLLLGWRLKSKMWIAVAGAAGAICILGRENMAAVVLLTPFLWLLPAVRRRLNWRFLSLHAAWLAGPVLLVMTLNLIAFGSFQPVPGNAGNVMGFYHGTETVRHFGALADALVKSVPAQFMNFFSSYESPNSLSFYAHREVIAFLRVFLLPFHLLTLLALIGVWRFRKNAGVATMALLVAAYAGSLLFFTIFYRFRIPAVPFIALLAGAGIAALSGWWKRKEYRSVVTAAVLGGAFLWITSVNPDSQRSFGERTSVARILIDNKRFDEAERYLAEMAADGFDIRAGAVLLAQHHAADGDPTRAQAVFNRFVRPGKPAPPAAP